MSLPEGKRTTYLQPVMEFKANYPGTNKAPRKALESLAGKLLYACQVCRWGYLYVQELLDSLYPGPIAPPPTYAVTLMEGVWL